MLILQGCIWYFCNYYVGGFIFTRYKKHTYELLHTKPVTTGKYVLGKVSAGFTICLLVLAILNILFWILCRIYTKDSGFEVQLWDFVVSTVLYILPNMLMIVSIYTLISLIFKNPLPGVPLLILYMVYSNMGEEMRKVFMDIGADLWQSWFDFPGSFLIRHRRQWYS